MVEISDPVVLKEDEVELELGLSIGGSFRRSETLKPSSERAFDSRRNDNGFDSDLRENDTASFRSDAVDSKTKREINALRRREARKKQREKRCRSASDSLAVDSAVGHASEADGRRQQQRATKREKTESLIDPVQYPHAPVQLVPITRGLAYPCVNLIPYWTEAFPAQLGGGAENSAFRAVPCGGFRPFLAHPSFGLNVTHRNGEAVAKTTSDHGSPMCSSSTVSDHQSRSSSLEGDLGSCSDTRTQNSSQSSRDQNQPKDHNNTNNNKFRSEAQSGRNSVASDQYQRKTVPPTQVSPKPSCLTKNTCIEIGKPPRPQCHNNNNSNAAKPIMAPQTAPFPQMPYVSARGDGPEGKTVTGLLYRYSDSEEVSIVCVCHGTAFSPAEFVRHAGGADVSHPLRHITVIPSAF